MRKRLGRSEGVSFELGGEIAEGHMIGRDAMRASAVAAMLQIPESELMSLANRLNLPFFTEGGILYVARKDLGRWTEAAANDATF